MLRQPRIGADPAGLEGNWSLPELINGGDRDARFWRDSRRLRSGLLCPRGRLRSKPRRCATSRPRIQPTARTAIETRDQGMRGASCSGTHCTILDWTEKDDGQASRGRPVPGSVAEITPPTLERLLGRGAD
jgi:hypothetical protein